MKFFGIGKSRVFNAQMARNLAIYSFEDEDNLERIVKSRICGIISDIKYKSEKGQTILTYLIKKEEEPLYTRISEILGSSEYGYKVVIGEIPELCDSEKYMHISWL